MASLSLLIFTPQTLQRFRSARPDPPASPPSAEDCGSVRELVLSTILFLLMAAAGLYGEILSHP
jgi:hypothetical protein